MEQIQRMAHVELDPEFRARLFELPQIAVVVNCHGEPVWEPTLFLAHTAMKSRSITGDTVRTYSEALLPWLSYLEDRALSLNQVTEETLGVYRANISHAVQKELGRPYASATINQRVIVAASFHGWGERSGTMSSPLGTFLENSEVRNYRGPTLRLRGSPTVATPRVIRRIPTALSVEQIRRLFLITPMPYRLILRWCLATGMRRLEVANLRLKDLPTPEQIAQADDRLARMQILRKGGRELTVHVPGSLIEETHWFILCDRQTAEFPDASHVFLNRLGRPISRQSITRQFKKSASAIGTDATLHHLRHTFAVHVLGMLEKQHTEGEPLNSIKTLQVMLGHASIESTEIYLQALQTSSEAVMEALDYLYGASL